jgi:hypothetical protein
MSVIYNAALKTTRMTSVLTAIDADAAAGKLEIGTTGMALLLAEFTLADPSGTVAGSVLTFDFDPDISDTSANNTGTAAAAQIKDGAGTVVISGLTVGTSGTDIILGSVSITAGQTVTLTAGTLTHG